MHELGFMVAGDLDEESRKAWNRITHILRELDHYFHFLGFALELRLFAHGRNHPCNPAEQPTLPGSLGRHLFWQEIAFEAFVFGLHRTKTYLNALSCRPGVTYHDRIDFYELRSLKKDFCTWFPNIERMRNNVAHIEDIMTNPVEMEGRTVRNASGGSFTGLHNIVGDKIMYSDKELGNISVTVNAASFGHIQELRERLMLVFSDVPKR